MLLEIEIHIQILALDSARKQIHLRNMDDPAKQANGDMSASIKFAMAMAIIESRRRQKLPSSSTTTQGSESDAIRWKRKVRVLTFLRFSSE